MTMVEPTAAQVHSACLSYRHDYGLLTTVAQKELQLKAREWLRACQKEGFCYSGDAARREEAGKAGAEPVERTSSELNHSPSGNLVPSRDSERKQYEPELEPGADKSEKGASPRSADEPLTNASGLRAALHSNISRIISRHMGECMAPEDCADEIVSALSSRDRA